MGDNKSKLVKDTNGGGLSLGLSESVDRRLVVEGW